MTRPRLALMARPKKAEPSERLALPRSVARRVRRLAAHADTEPGEWLAERIGGMLDKEESRMLADIEREKARKGDSAG